MNTEDDPCPKKIKFDDDDDLSEIISVTPTKSSIQESNTFHPLHLISIWQEPSTTAKRITVSIILPSGVNAGDFTIRIIEDGDVLELTVDWPKPLVDISFMHKKWLQDYASNFTDFHPKFLGFEASLRKLRENLSDKVVSVARIGLPFSVQSHIESKHNIGFRDDTSRLVYVDLKAVEEKYAIVNDVSEFEII